MVVVAAGGCGGRARGVPSGDDAAPAAVASAPTEPVATLPDPTDDVTVRIRGQWWRAEDAARARAAHEGTTAAALDASGTAWVVATRRGLAAYVNRGDWVVELSTEGDDTAAREALLRAAAVVELDAAATAPGLALTWPRATPDDRRLAHEIVDLARTAIGTLLPSLAPDPGTTVRVNVRRRVGGPKPVLYRLDQRTVVVEEGHLERLTFAHEVTHALLHARLGFPPPAWLDEGVAQIVAATVIRDAAFPPPPGRPVGDFARLRSLTGAQFIPEGPAAYAAAAEWVGFLRPGGTAPAEERAAFERYVAALLDTRNVAAADQELDGIRGAGPRR